MSVINTTLKDNDGNTLFPLTNIESVIGLNNEIAKSYSFPSIISGQITTCDITGGDKVVEQYLSSDGNTWYRKWASGWKEQGGFYDNGSETNDKSGIVITFPLAFSNTTKYIIVSQAFKVNGTTDASNRAPVATIYNQTSSGFYGGWYGYTGRYLKWYACGY